MKALKHILFTLTVFCAFSAAADNVDNMRDLAEQTPSVHRNHIRGYAWRVDEEGDKVLVVYLQELTVYPPLKFKNKKDEEFYWRTVRDVKLTLPYAKLIGETLIETYEYISTFEDKKEADKYLKEMESAVFKQYKPVLKRFSRRQARVLVKLIERETHQTSYDIVKAFLGDLRAAFWQGFGALFGVSLKAKYEPTKNKEDAMLDRIAKCVEQGTL